jgi:hypothetical protein
MSPEQFVDNGFVSRPNDRVWPTVSSKTRGSFYIYAAKPAKHKECSQASERATTDLPKVCRWHEAEVRRTSVQAWRSRPSQDDCNFLG